MQTYIISIADIYDSLGYCTVQSSKFLPTFRVNLYVPSSKFKKFKKNDSFSTNLSLKRDPIDCPKTSYGIPTLRCAISQKARSDTLRGRSL